MKSNKAQRRSLRLEPLESRLAMDSTASAAAGLPWFDLGALTYSFVPDGTRMGRHASTLFDELASTGTTEQWQEEFRLAMDSWLNTLGVAVHQVNDQGLPLGTFGATQGDSRFGDIRIAAVPLSDNVLAEAVPHAILTQGSWAGDILLNSNAEWNSLQQVYAIALHEMGHVLGLGHSQDPNSPMFSHNDNQAVKPTSDDVLSLKKLYAGVSVHSEPFEEQESQGFEWRPKPEVRLDFPSAQPLQASLSSSARYSASGLLTSQQTTVLYRLEPIGEIDHAEYLNLVVAADQFGGLYPDLEIYDSSGDRIPTRVLHYSSGVLVVQAKDVEPNHPYYIAITPASTAAAHQVGGFEFIGEFGSTRLDPTSIGIFSLNAQKPVLELPITLQTSRLVHVLIDSLDTESARPDEAIWATIVDEQGSILAQLGMNQGQSRSFPIVFLEPGDYRIIVQSGRVDLGPIRLQRLRISVDEISVDIGPGVMNPILQPVVPGNSQVPTPTRPANPPIVINAPLYPNPTVLPQNPIYPSIAPFGTPSWFFWPTMESQMTSTSHPARQIALDVSKDTMVTPRDALLILNYLNAPTEVPDQDYDCNGDGFVTPLDALLILNFLNARISAEGEQVDPVGVERISFAPSVAMAPSDGGAETMDAKRRKGQG